MLVQDALFIRKLFGQCRAKLATMGCNEIFDCRRRIRMAIKMQCQRSIGIQMQYFARSRKDTRWVLGAGGTNLLLLLICFFNNLCVMNNRVLCIDHT